MPSVVSVEAAFYPNLSPASATNREPAVRKMPNHRLLAMCGRALLRCPLCLCCLFFVPLALACRTTIPLPGLCPPGPCEFASQQTPNPVVPDPKVSLERGRTLLKNGDLQGADAAVAAYIVIHPDSADAHFLRGYIFFKLNQAAASLAEYTEGAKYAAPEPSDLKVVALDYVLLGSYSDADRWLTRSLEGNARDPESWYYLGRAKYSENRFAEAIHAFEECLKLEPANVKAEANRGLALAALGRAEEALAAYRHAIVMQEAAPVKTAEPFIDLGDLLLDQNQLEEALADLLKAREISPEESRVHESLGKVYLRLNKLPEAQTEFEKTISLAPGDAAAHYMLGQVYRKKGLLAEAKAEFDRAEKLSAKEPPAKQP
jgi:tetratricopeptide (TPR) repeat protein